MYKRVNSNVNIKKLQSFVVIIQYMVDKIVSVLIVKMNTYQNSVHALSMCIKKISTAPHSRRMPSK